jgi:hypothetical protein
MDRILTIILANEKRNFSLYFAEIGDETVISRTFRLLEQDRAEIVVISDYRERVCPGGCVSIIPTTTCGTLREVWTNVRDYEFKLCRVLYGSVVLSNRMAKSIQQDKRHIGLYGNDKRVFGFVLHRDRKNDFLAWSLREWRKHPMVDLSSMVQFCSGKLLLSTDYSDEYYSDIELKALNDDRKYKRSDVKL